MEVVHSMKEGDIAFSHPRGPVGWLISHFTQGPFSHVRYIMDSYGNTIEATWPRIRYSHVKMGDVVWESTYDAAEIREMSRRAFKMVGWTYSIISLCTDYLKWMGVPLVIEIEGEYNCVQFVELVTNAVQFNPTDSPNDLARALHVIGQNKQERVI